MTLYNKISDEDLAAYLEGMLSDQDKTKVDNAIDIDTFEVLSVSRRAMNEIHKDNVVELPSWKNVSIETVTTQPLYEPLAMAGFLGDMNTEEGNIEDSSNR